MSTVVNMKRTFSLWCQQLLMHNLYHTCPASALDDVIIDVFMVLCDMLTLQIFGAGTTRCLRWAC